MAKSAPPQSPSPAAAPVVAPAQRRTLRRSPNFPYIDLPTALARIRVLYQHEGRNPTPMSVVAAHWGYSPTSSSMDKVVGALNSYGLVEVQGSGDGQTLRLTERSLDILEDEREESEDRTRAIQAAALGPSIHRIIRERFGQHLPSDANLRTVLIRELNFNPKSVATVIANYRSTIEHAGLDSADNAGHTPEVDRQPPNRENVRPAVGDLVQWEHNDVLGLPEPRKVKGLSDNGEWVFVDGSTTGLPIAEVLVVSRAPQNGAATMVQANTPPPMTPAVVAPLAPIAPGGTMRDLTIPLVGGAMAILRTPVPMSEQNFQLLTSLLATMKPAIVTEASPRRIRMQEEVAAGETIDVRSIGVETEPGIFKLTHPEKFDKDADVDYCDIKEQARIWSIGKRKATGEIFASTSARYYENPEFECLWLR
jgi:hypothetical protein